MWCLAPCVCLLLSLYQPLGFDVDTFSLNLLLNLRHLYHHINNFNCSKAFPKWINVALNVAMSKPPSNVTSSCISTYILQYWRSQGFLTFNSLHYCIYTLYINIASLVFIMGENGRVGEEISNTYRLLCWPSHHYVCPPPHPHSKEIYFVQYRYAIVQYRVQSF